MVLSRSRPPAAAPVDQGAPGHGLTRLGETPPLGRYLRAVWGRREFAIAVPLAEFRSQNANTSLGQAWHLLNPLLLIGTYWLIFGVVLNTSRGVDNFIAFLTVGVFTFRYSQKCAVDGASSISRNVGLMRSIAFPRAVLPISAVLGETLSFLPSLAVMLFVALVTGEALQWSWLLLPVLFASQFVFNLGLAFSAARLTDRFADVENLLPYAFRLLFYGSGVLYSVEQRVTDPVARMVFTLNPFHAYVSLARDLIMEGRVDGVDVVVALSWTLVLLLGGFLFFRRAEHRYGRA